MDQEADRRARAREPVTHGFGDRQHRLLSGKRFANDGGEESGGSLIWSPRPDHDARQPDADAVDESAARVVS